MESWQGDRKQRKTIYLVGIGMGGADQLTLQGENCIRRAQAVAGAARLLDSVQPLLEGKEVLASYRGDEIARWLSRFPDIDQASVVFSGDVGFYSGAPQAKDAFQQAGWSVQLVPGISSLSYLASKAGISWQDAETVSLHGREDDALEKIRKSQACFLLLGGKETPFTLCRKLEQAGLGDRRMVFGAWLSYPQEEILQGTAKELLAEKQPALAAFPSLCCALALGEPERGEKQWSLRAFSLKDHDFIRGNVPMTKEEIRTQCLAKLALEPGAVLYDIGAGTGSVAVAAGMALEATGGQIWAVEKNPEAVRLIQANREKFLPGNRDFHVREGEAPGCLRDLPAPTHAFIGGSGGELPEIINILLAKNPRIRIVISAITLETLTAALEAARKWGFEEEIVQIGIAKTEQIGPYHMQKSQNPIYLITLSGAKGGPL